MNFIINEKMHAEKLMETGDISQRKTSRDLKYIAKYLLGNGFSEDYTISYLIDFMNNYNNSGSRWKNTIVGIVKDIKKQNNYFLRDIDDIRITQNEINAIKNINWSDTRLNDRMKRYAFGLIVYAKILRQKQKDGWVRIDNTSVFCDDIGVKPQSVEIREKTFNKLQELGLLETPRKTGSDSIKVLFVDWEEHDNDIIIPLNKIEEFKEYYEVCIIETKCICEDCGMIFNIRERKMKYCENCTKERKRRYAKESMRKSRATKNDQMYHIFNNKYN